MKTTTRCLYCGKVCPWWECDCPASHEVREGKRIAPKVVRRNGRTIIIADEETVRANHFQLERYRAKQPEAQ